MTETGHSGPLSYEIPDEVEDVSAQRPIIVGSLAAIGLSIVAFILAFWAMGVVRSRGLVVWSAPAVVVVATVVVALLMTRGGPVRRRRNAVLGSGTTAVLCAFLTGQALGLTTPTFPQIEAAFDAFRPPAGMVQVAETRDGGRLCRPCPLVSRTFRAPQALERPTRVVVQSFYDQGWAPLEPNQPREGQSIVVKGTLLADVLETTDPAVVRVVMTARKTVSVAG